MDESSQDKSQDTKPTLRTNAQPMDDDGDEVIDDVDVLEQVSDGEVKGVVDDFSDTDPSVHSELKEGKDGVFHVEEIEDIYDDDIVAL